MLIKIPENRAPREASSVPPAGNYEAVVSSAKESEEEDIDFVVEWRYEAGEDTWHLEQKCSEAELMAILVDLGLGGQEASLEDVGGKKAMIKVATYGGRSSAKVKDVWPVRKDET